MNTLRDLKEQATARLLNGDHETALWAFGKLVGAAPTNLDARLRVADCLLALGQAQAAATVYTAVARHSALTGYPLRALAALKILAKLEPKMGQAISGLAGIYSCYSPRISQAVSQPAFDDLSGPLPPGFEIGQPPPTDKLVEAAVDMAANTGTMGGDTNARVRPLVIFSELPDDDFTAVFNALILRRYRPGDKVIEQGQTGQSFYIVVRGTVRVSRTTDEGEEVTLADLSDRAIFGEMALVSAQPRSATVTALDDCDLLEFDQKALEAADEQLGTVGRALAKFTSERLLKNMLATSALFRPLDREQRLDLMKRFGRHEVQPGDHLIEEGHAGRGLFVVLSGQVEVWKQDGGNKVSLATLGPGEMFGEISLVHEEVTTATVTAVGHATVLFLKREIFQRLLQAFSTIREYVEELGEERLMDTAITMSEDDMDESIDVDLDDIIMV